MKIVQINTFPYKATGAIMMSIHQQLQKEGQDSYVVWGRGRNSTNNHEIVMKDRLGIKWHGLYTRVTDKTGFASKRATEKLADELERIKPDIIHLHNLHGYYLNIELLFCYLKKTRPKIVWTFHDCWPFTGHCAYFDMIGCEKWKNGCTKCPQKTTYPTSFVMDNSSWNWHKKRELFTGLDMTIVTPSRWLRDIVKESFLKECNVVVIHNGIDTNVYKTSQSNTYHSLAGNKKMILGVASEWTDRKGYKDFVKLHSMLDTSKFVIALVGLSKKQIKELPVGMVGIERTSNVQELVKLYSQADWLFNPTYDDNFPTTNLEAISCGTPVITYKTGGSPETIRDSNGWVVEKGDLNMVCKIMNGKSCMPVCLNDEFKKETMVENYLQLYRSILK